MLELALDPIVPGSAPAPGVASDRRLYLRHTLDELPWLRSVRVKNGPELSIVDFSAGGLQVDVDNYHLRPGSLVTIEIVARSNRLSVPADVLRCRVLALTSSIKYRGALAFKTVIDVPALADDVVGRLIAARAIASVGADIPLKALGEMTPATAPAPTVEVAVLPVGWNRIVVRYADGRLAKGFCQDFFPPRGHFHLWRMPSVLSRDRVTIPIGDLKAVFFVRDFDGNPGYVEEKTAARPSSGRAIAVTFLDNEEMTGTTMNYQPGALGFFIQPLDAANNNLRAYVVSRTVRHVRFL
ncbi:MAG: PilZ domain-containing protein [Acidobacteriota bacterium]